MDVAETTAHLNTRHVRSILLLPFEDQELQIQIQQMFPQASLSVLRKQDLAGLSLRKLVSTVRKQRYDLAVASLYSSAVRRSTSSVQVLLILTRARHRMIKMEDGGFWGCESRSIAFSILPRLLAGATIGIAVVAWTYQLFFPRHPGVQKGGERRTGKTDAGLQKRVLFLRTDLAASVKAGGSVSHVKGMVQAFVQAGFEVLYVADAPLDVLPKEVRQIRLRPMRILDFFDEFQLLAYNLQCIRHLKRIIKETRPSFIYQRHSIFNFAGPVVARRFSIPCVLEANDSEVWIKKHWSRLVLEDLATRSEALALQLADRIAVISTGVQEQLAQYRIKRERYLLNPNGVDPEEFHPDIDGTAVRQRHDIGDQIVIGFIGSFTRWHGIETLFDAAVIAAQKESRLRFLFIGEGDLRSALEKRSMDLGLQQAIIFTGLIPHSEAPGYLAACDILVSPHLGFQDGTKFFGSPTKLFEYMAMGKPIIASRLEQIGEVIVDGVNGLHMNPGDVQQLADLILKLARNGELRKKLGAQARQDVVRNHTWSANVERIVKSFESSSP